MILHELTVGQTVILSQRADTDPGSPDPSEGPLGRVMLGEFRRDYDEAATLEFTLFRPWNEVAFQADQLVTLRLTNTETGVSRIVFTGLLDPVRPIASVHQGPAQQYTARDHSHALAQSPALHSNGRPGIRLPGSTLGAMVTEYLTHVTGELTRVGVASDALYIGGADAVEAWPVSLDTESIDEGFRMIAAAAPGVAVFLDPNEGVPTYRFVRLFAAPRRTITLDETRVEDASIAQSVDGCYGAIEIYEQTVIGDYSAHITRPLQPAWDAELEADWIWAHSASTDESGNEDALSEVFRRWSFASFVAELQEGTDMVALVEGVKFIPVRYVRVKVVAIDFASQTLLLQQPAIEALVHSTGARRNPNIPGQSRAGTTLLRFRQEGQAPVSTTPVRVPETGFAGRAYSLSPIHCGCVKAVVTPAGVSPEAYAQAAFDALSEPRASGSLPIAGRLDLDLFFLGYRLAFDTAAHGVTNAEDLDAPMTAVAVDFATGGTATISFNRDSAANLLGEGAA